MLPNSQVNLGVKNLVNKGVCDYVAVHMRQSPFPRLLAFTSLFITVLFIRHIIRKKKFKCNTGDIKVHTNTKCMNRDVNFMLNRLLFKFLTLMFHNYLLLIALFCFNINFFLCLHIFLHFKLLFFRKN